MVDLIDRNALIQDLKEHKIPFNADINEAIMVAPTVDAEPVKHGKWIGVDNNGYAPYKCSICGIHRQVWDKTPYCAICGAKMTLD